MVLAPAFSESIFHNLDRREKTLAEQVLGEGSNYRTGLFRKTKGLRPDSIINPGKISSRATRFSSQCSLESIFTGLDEILKYASADPDERIRRLENEADEIRAEIDRIRATGAVTSFSPVQINERYAQVLGTARELLSDFRQVEENFKRVAREIAERQTQPGITKGAIVGHLL